MLNKLDAANYSLSSNSSVDEATTSDMQRLRFTILNEMIYCATMSNEVDIRLARQLIRQFVVDKEYDIDQLLQNSSMFYSIRESQLDSA